MSCSQRRGNIVTVVTRYGDRYKGENKMDFISKKVTTSSTTPAAGSNATLTVPTGEVWEVQWIVAELVTSAVAASRYMNVVPFINGQNLRSRYNPYAQPASTTAYYSLAEGLPNDTTLFQQSVTQSFPKLTLGPGDYLITSVAGIDPGDQITLTAAYSKYPSN